MQQKALILDSSTFAQLSQLIAQGWKVAHSCPMPSGGNYPLPTCLVVLEKPL